MHECPRCGQMCYCHGDMDDTVVETYEYSDSHCYEDHDGCTREEEEMDDIEA
jgi:hypothetical protein